MTRVGIPFEKALQALIELEEDEAETRWLGIPLEKPIALLGARTKKPGNRQLIEFLHEKICAGVTISEAVRATGDAFPNYVAGTLKAAEQSGKLDDALIFLARVEEKEQKLKRQFRQALSYPLWVSGTGLLIFLVLAWFLKGLKTVFQEIGAQMSVSLEFLINLAELALNPWFLLALAAVCFLFYKRLGNAKFRRTLRNKSKDLGLPVFSRVIVLTANIHFCRLLAMQIEAGCPLLPALSRALKGSDDETLIKQANQDKKGSILWKVINGTELSQALEQSGYFSTHLVSMIRVAEESGSMPKALMGVADFLQSELDYRFEQFASLVQPVFTVFIGGGVAFVAIMTFLPLLEVMNL